MNNEQIIDFLLTYGESREWSDNTFKTYLNTLNILNKQTGKRIVDLKPIDINIFLKNRKDTVSVKNANSSLRNLKAIFSVLEDNEIIERNITHRIKPFPDNTKKNEDDYLTVSEVRKVLRIAKNRKNKHAKATYIYMLILFYTGMRCMEVSKLKTKNVKYLKDEQVIELTIKNTKNKKDFTTYIVKKDVVKEVYEWLKIVGDKEYLFVNENGNFIFKSEGCNSVQNIFKKIVKDAGIERRVVCHGARKSFATTLRDADVNIIDIEQLLNHSVKSLGASTYARQTKEVKIKILKKLRY